MSERTYTEREVAAIIEAAIERQEEARRQRPETGLTIEELERLGRDVGIDPAFLRAAAADVDRGGRTLDRSATQTKTHVVVERWLQGPLQLEAWEEAVSELQERFGADAGAAWGRAAGGLSQVGNTYEWTHSSHLGVQTRITVRARGDRTQLRMTQLVGLASPNVEGPLYGGILTMVLGLIPALKLFEGQPALIAAFTLAAFALFSGLVFYHDRKWRAKKLRELDSLADELGRRLTAPDPELAAPLAEPARQTDAAPRLGLPDDAPEAEPAPARTGRRARS